MCIILQIALATQTLSNSVADAITSLKELGLPEYNNCDATVKFIKVNMLSLLWLMSLCHDSNL